MKKNFLMVAALLIAAMLMVVSCTQEVAPKNELVETTIGLAYGKDVTVGYGKNAAITYKYELKPLWDNLSNGAPIYGTTNGEVVIYEGKKIGDPLDPFKSNYVTPGYWQINVNGYVGDVVILTGSTKAYFNEGNGIATVYVSPVDNDNTGKLTFNLVMEDLDADDAANNTDSKIYYYFDNNVPSEGAEEFITKRAVVAEDKAAHNYSLDVNGVASGYHTVTIKVKGYDGGITKSFLMIPGNDVTITGSVYPSKFKETDSTIKVVSLGQKNLTAAGKIFTEKDNAPVVVSVTNGNLQIDESSNKKTIAVSIEAFTAPVVADADSGYTVNTGITYSWYLDGEKKGEDVTGTNSATIELPTTESGALVPGDYTVSCIVKFSYTDAANNQYTIYGSEKYAGKVRVEASDNKKYQAPASNE